MEVRRWRVIDIYYTAKEKAKVERLVARHPDYDRRDCEPVNDWDESIQLISPVAIREE